jgi:hypothetical protein
MFDAEPLLTPLGGQVAQRSVQDKHEQMHEKSLCTMSKSRKKTKRSPIM